MSEYRTSARGKHICEICGYGNYVLGNMKRHLDEGHATCQLCGKITRRDTLERHINRMHRKIDNSG